MAEAYGTPRPRTLPPWILRLAAPYVTSLAFNTSMRVSNAKAKAELGWSEVSDLPRRHRGQLGAN